MLKKLLPIIILGGLFNLWLWWFWFSKIKMNIVPPTVSTTVWLINGFLAINFFPTLRLISYTTIIVSIVLTGIIFFDLWLNVF